MPGRTEVSQPPEAVCPPEVQGEEPQQVVSYKVQVNGSVEDVKTSSSTGEKLQPTTQGEGVGSPSRSKGRRVSRRKRKKEREKSEGKVAVRSSQCRCIV